MLIQSDITFTNIQFLSPGNTWNSKTKTRGETRGETLTQTLNILGCAINLHRELNSSTVNQQI